ncbi:MAG: glutamate synthase subunit beta [Planctomycetes bacterium]|nr:glutamate synthase subunit beta [Planctomycetota bacterium]
MAKPTGFLEFSRQDAPKRPIAERVRDWREFVLLPPEAALARQAARCMDCGIPFCHAAGCPLGNLIPDFNDAVYRGRWREALDLLHRTNNFPEFTGRLCPAPCEAACTLAINCAAVTIELIEHAIADRGFREGWIAPEPPASRTGRRIAIVGSGPAGLAAAQQLNRMGHTVRVYERADRVGGLLRYGIPDFKIEKHILDRRLEQLVAEGVELATGVDVGRDVRASYLHRKYDVLLIATGARIPRDLPIEGRDLDGIHFAMDYLTQSNRRTAEEALAGEPAIDAEGKVVVVIGGGDTGSDCVGTARRQGAREIHQIEILPQPPAPEGTENPDWPNWPWLLRTSSSHEEGCLRRWSIATKAFLGEGGRVRGIRCIRVQWDPPGPDGRRSFSEVPNSEFTIACDQVFLAMGFLHLEHAGIVDELGMELDPRGNVRIDEIHQTSVPRVFAAGDAALGASLVVRAIAQGRLAAEGIDRFLSGR